MRVWVCVWGTNILNNVLFPGAVNVVIIYGWELVFISHGVKMSYIKSKHFINKTFFFIIITKQGVLWREIYALLKI